MSTPPPLFAVIGDVHGRMGLLRTVLRRISREKVQGILLVGDLSCARNAPRGSGRGARYLEVVGEVLAAVRAVARPVFFVPGNHDWPDLELPGNLDCRAITVGGVSLAGLGGAGPARFGFPYEWSENDAAMRLPQKADILVSHTPPLNTPLDLTYTKVQAGSAAVRTWAIESRSRPHMRPSERSKSATSSFPCGLGAWVRSPSATDSATSTAGWI
jgi:Icc-related predicted phosphoesterase